MTTCPNCGIIGPSFSCPNHTYCWGTGNTQSSTIQPQVTWMPVSEQLNNSSLFSEIGRLNVLLNERDKEIERLRGERPAVVAWLRRNPGVSRAPECVTAMTPFEAADAIERGEHRHEDVKS